MREIDSLETRPASNAVTAALTYMRPSEQRPYVNTEALTGAAVPEYHAILEQHPTEIRDARDISDDLDIDLQGFECHRAGTAVRDFYDDDSVRQHYYPEVESLIRDRTGAPRVFIFDHTRRRTNSAANEPAKTPASRVHNDYTEWSGKARLRQVLPADVQAAMSGFHYAQINLWRPISGPVQRQPLALLDASSLDHADLVATDMRYPDRTGEIYHLAHNPAQRWFYFPHMSVDEYILIKGYDSRCDGRARFTPHAAFEHPSTHEDAPARESIEVRALVFWT